MRFLFFAFLLLATGCASLHREALHQGVLVSSQPQGATILVNKQPAGRTPQYLMIRRSSQPKVQLETGRGIVDVEFNTNYRWRDSFFSNLVFLLYAPIGWAVDAISGAAWDIEPNFPKRVLLTKKDYEFAQKPKPFRKSAIAPPLAESLLVSDAGGKGIEKLLMERGHNREIVPYDESLSIFVSQGYDYDGALPADESGTLNYKLGVDTVFESRIARADGKLVLTVRERDLKDAELKTATPVRMTLEATNELERTFFADAWWVRLLPNSIGVDFLNEKFDIRTDNEFYQMRPAGGKEWYSTGLRYLSAINVSSLPPRRSGRAARWSFSAVPSLRISRASLSSSGLPTTGIQGDDESEFIRWWVAGGYGGELGFQVSSHYFYVNLVPVLFYTHITYERFSSSESVSGNGLNIQTEAGYNYFFSSNWCVRLFVRNTTEDEEAWKDLLRARLLEEPQKFSAQSVTSGLSILYRFEPKVEYAKWSAGKGRRL